VSDDRSPSTNPRGPQASHGRYARDTNPGENVRELDLVREDLAGDLASSARGAASRTVAIDAMTFQRRSRSD
jgi:hypothetical protein